MVDPTLLDSDLVLVVPPLAHLTWPALGAETIAAVARAAGVRTGVVYANALLASRIGVADYASLANAPGDWLLGDRLFARAAFGVDALAAPDFAERIAAFDQETDALAGAYVDHLSDGSGHPYTPLADRYPRDRLERAAREGEALLDELAAELARVPVVACSTSFDQTTASLALLARVKALRPEVRTVLGGANCDGPMGAALRALAPSVDAVFSGESEAAFTAWLTGNRREGVVHGAPCTDLDALPTPDFTAYFDQLARWAPEVLQGPVWLSYESSRGCWWGQRHHCTFCGLNGTGMAFRARSPERVLSDLTAMFARYPTRHVAMADNIMPHGYHRTLVPRLAEAAPGAHVFYEQKANLSLAQVVGLVDAGVKVIQPGIESLSTALLRRMKKGTTARQNVDLLRYARSAGQLVKWNLLWAFPGDHEHDYLEMLALIPHLHHLNPPHGLVHLSIDRFSPYHERPADHGIEAVEPIAAYREIYPPGADLDAIAYHFVGRWPSGGKEAPETIGRLWGAVQAWRTRWSEGSTPDLRLARAGAGFVLTDTRGDAPAVHRLGPDQARAVIAGTPEGDPVGSWAVRRGFAVPLDGRIAGLAVAAPALFAELLEPRTEAPCP